MFANKNKIVKFSLIQEDEWEFGPLIAKLKQAIESLQKMSPEEQAAADDRLDKFQKMSKKEQRAFMAKIEKLESGMAALAESKPS